MKGTVAMNTFIVNVFSVVSNPYTGDMVVSKAVTREYTVERLTSVLKRIKESCGYMGAFYDMINGTASEVEVARQLAYNEDTVFAQTITLSVSKPHELDPFTLALKEAGLVPNAESPFDDFWSEEDYREAEILTGTLSGDDDGAIFVQE